MTARNIHFLIMIANAYKLVLAEPKQSVELWKTMFQSLLICGTYIWGVLLFEWVLILEKSVAIASMGTYICGVLVFDGYLYSREYSISSHICILPICAHYTCTYAHYIHVLHVH